jgi:hypothetical protein
VKLKPSTQRRKKQPPTKRELALFLVRHAFNTHQDFRKAALMAAKDLIDMARAERKT